MCVCVLYGQARNTSNQAHTKNRAVATQPRDARRNGRQTGVADRRSVPGGLWLGPRSRLCEMRVSIVVIIAASNDDVDDFEPANHKCRMASLDGEQTVDALESDYMALLEQGHFAHKQVRIELHPTVLWSSATSATFPPRGAGAQSADFPSSLTDARRWQTRRHAALAVRMAGGCGGPEATATSLR